MPEPIWIDRSEKLPPLARTLESHASIGVDTEFLRERTFFPKLCLLQLAAGGEVWCVDTLHGSAASTSWCPRSPPRASRKVIHSARQDLEAFYLNAKRVISPVFDTQIAAGCIGLKPQIGYAELVKTLLGRRACRRVKRAPTGRSVRSPGNSWNTRPTMCCISSEIADRLTRAAAVLGARALGVGGLPRARGSAPLRARPRARMDEAARSRAAAAGAARARAEPCGVARASRARAQSAARAGSLSDAAIFSVAESAAPARCRFP